MNFQTNLSNWNAATTALPWGTQRVLLDALTLVYQGKTTMVYGRDYSSSGDPCLINTAAPMLAKLSGEGGSGKPSKYFNAVVNAFDGINNFLENQGLNSEYGVVSPEAAHVLIKHFGKLKTIEEATEIARRQDENEIVPVMEDGELLKDWLDASMNPAPNSIVEEKHDV